MPISFDEYWCSLIHRVYHGRETLQGVEDSFYRLSCIYGESMVDGIESYFDRRWQEFEKDMHALSEAGFNDIAIEYRAISAELYGGAELSQALIDSVAECLRKQSAPWQAAQRNIDAMYDRVIPRLDTLVNYRDQLGLSAGLYSVIE